MFKILLSFNGFSINIFNILQISIILTILAPIWTDIMGTISY